MTEQNRVQKGVSTGGQYAPTAHTEPQVSLGNPGGLHIDKDAADLFTDQAEAIRAAGLTGSLTSDGDSLTYTTADDRFRFEIAQDGHEAEDGSAGWAISNEPYTDTHEVNYGMRTESTTDELGPDLQAAVWDSACGKAFTLANNTEDLEAQTYTVELDNDGDPHSTARFAIPSATAYLEVDYNHETGELKVWDDDRELSTEEIDNTEMLADLLNESDDADESPGGRIHEKLGWHMERSFRTAAAYNDSPEWAHEYRVNGLDWKD